MDGVTFEIVLLVLIQIQCRDCHDNLLITSIILNSAIRNTIRIVAFQEVNIYIDITFIATTANNISGASRPLSLSLSI